MTRTVKFLPPPKKKDWAQNFSSASQSHHKYEQLFLWFVATALLTHVWKCIVYNALQTYDFILIPPTTTQMRKWVSMLTDLDHFIKLVEDDIETGFPVPAFSHKRKDAPEYTPVLGSRVLLQPEPVHTTTKLWPSSSPLISWGHNRQFSSNSCWNNLIKDSTVSTNKPENLPTPSPGQISSV